MDELEEAVYARIATEMGSGDVSRGLMAKAVELARGNREVAEAHYIKLRAKQLKAQMKEALRLEKDAQRRRSEEEQRQSQQAAAEQERDSLVSELRELDRDEAELALIRRAARRVNMGVIALAFVPALIGVAIATPYFTWEKFAYQLITIGVVSVPLGLFVARIVMWFMPEQRRLHREMNNLTSRREALQNRAKGFSKSRTRIAGTLSGIVNIVKALMWIIGILFAFSFLNKFMQNLG